MKTHHAFLLRYILFALIFLPTGSVFAWGAITNPPSVWTSLPVPYYVNNSGCADIGGFDAAVNACEVSFDAWENNDCTSWQVSFMGGTAASPTNGGDGINTQGWIESGWRFGSGAIGVCQLMFYGGRISGADIAYNGVNYTWNLTGGGGSSVDTQSIVTHEEGHFVGLDDLYSCWSDPQTMCGYYSGGTASRTLTSDDIAGVCTLYPGTGPQPDCTTSAECEDKYECIGEICVGRMCAKCGVHDDCGDGDDFCLGGFVDGQTYCGVACTSDPECGAGSSCFDLGGGIKQCLPVTLDCSGTIPDCTTTGDCPDGYVCEGGFCVPAPPPTCSDSDDCDEGYYCVDGFCVPDTRPHNPVCSQCAVDDDCGYDDDRCITLFPDGSTFTDGLSYCGVSCDSVGGDCGAGFECMEFDDKPDQCLPTGQSCMQCDPIFFTVGCEEGYYCDFVTCSMGVCRPGSTGSKKFAEPCDGDLDCESLQCVKQTSGSYCSAACTFFEGCYGFNEDVGLELDMTCQPLEYGMCGYCSCDAGRLGDSSCNRNTDCQSGGCLKLPDGSDKVCSMYCGGPINCPEYFQCLESGEDDGAWACFMYEGIKKPGDPCTGEMGEICLGGTCHVQADSGEQFCTRMCEGECKCPVNMHCETTEEYGSMCMMGGRLKSGCGCIVVGEESSATAILLAFLFVLLPFAFILFRRLRRKGL